MSTSCRDKLDSSAILTSSLTQSEWHDVLVSDTIKDIVTRVSFRVFVGPELCRDPDWLRISRLYQTQSLKALRFLRLFPKLMRPLVGRFGSECGELRRMLAETRRLTGKVLREREAARLSSPETQHNDALTWAEELAKAKGIRSDAAVWQLALSTVALHTSSDLIGQVVLDLCEHPELLPPLREEIQDMISRDGGDVLHCKWSKASMQSLRLMDSVLKESQRLKPLSISKSNEQTSIAVADRSERTYLTARSLYGALDHARHYPSRWHNSSQGLRRCNFVSPDVGSRYVQESENIRRISVL